MSKPKKKSYFERYAYDQLTRNKSDQVGEELFLLSEKEIAALRKIRIATYLKAIIAGSLGVVLLYVPYHLWGDILFPTTKVPVFFLNDPLPLEIEFLVYSVVLVIAEIWYLTVVNIKAVSAIAAACGCPSTSDPNFEDNVGALIAVGLEKKQKELASIGINPYEGLSKWSVILYQVVLKLKAALSGFLLKLLVTKVLGRYALRMIVDLAGIPVYAFWNAWGVRTIMNETRVRVMAPPLINKFTQKLYNEFKDNDQFKSTIYNTLQAISTSKRSFHYNHFLLATSILNKFEIPVSTQPNYEEDFLKNVPKFDAEVERAIAKLLLFGIMIDGRLSMREKRALQNLRELKVMPYTEDQVKRWTKDYFEGRGLEEFLAS
ncbi:MAG: hypothetical protein IPG07_18385 [Crocinitomicaceae bacterium]|nr:hypothetical protein [Crocinitomicaceae bacterium]